VIRTDRAAGSAVRLAPAPTSTCSGLLALLFAIGTRLASIRDGGTWAFGDAAFGSGCLPYAMRP